VQLRALGLVVLVWGCSRGETSTADSSSLVIENVVVIDGTGSARRPASVRVAGDRIREVGDVQPMSGERTVDGGGLVLAPGFIDTHSHGDRSMDEHPDALGAVSQGITTIIGGQDGGSPVPLKSFLDTLEKSPVAVNVGMYVGHGELRERVMGGDYKRPARPDEVAKMRELLAQELSAGALGMSTGLEYDPGIYSSPDEVLALAKDVAAVGGRYISHIRSEDFAFWKAIDEIIRIGREAKLPVQISHTKLAMRDLWGKADSLIAILDQARAEGVDVTADIYPYLYWQSTLTVLFPKRNFEDRKAAEFALTQTSTPGGLLLGRYEPNPSYSGKTVAEIAALRGVDSVTALIDLIRDAEAMRKKEGRGVESVIGTSMVESDVERIMKWEHTNFCTDGELDGRHPRGFGSYPRILGHYVRTRKAMSLEEAIRRATSLAASHTGLVDRGFIRPGAFADLVLFDPATVTDRATPQEPQAVSVGIARVWVNGVEVFAGGKTTGARPGIVLRRE
jgi:N-acyl-D-amino-acid deacylase